MSDMMRHAGKGGNAAPRTDQGKAEGALFKQDGEKDSGESLTPPPGAQASPAPHSHQER
jgi:cytochrome o ubiquinol oxidase subunit 2